MGPWRQGERDFTIDDKSRLWLEIDSNRGCLQTEEAPSSGPNAATEPVVYVQRPVLPEGRVELRHKYIKS